MATLTVSRSGLLLLLFPYFPFYGIEQATLAYPEALYRGVKLASDAFTPLTRLCNFIPPLHPRFCPTDSTAETVININIFATPYAFAIFLLPCV